VALSSIKVIPIRGQVQVAAWRSLYLGINMRIQLKQDRTHRWLLWWTADGTKWFPLNCENVQAIPNENPDPFGAYRAYREAMNRVHQGFTETFEGNYYKTSGKMGVRALGAATAAVISRLG